MKRITILSVVLVIVLVSIGGCWVGIDADGGRDGRHDRQQKHDQRR